MSALWRGYWSYTLSSRIIHAMNYLYEDESERKQDREVGLMGLRAKCLDRFYFGKGELHPSHFSVSRGVVLWCTRCRGGHSVPSLASSSFSFNPRPFSIVGLQPHVSVKARSQQYLRLTRIEPSNRAHPEGRRVQSTKGANGVLIKIRIVKFQVFGEAKFPNVYVIRNSS